MFCSLAGKHRVTHWIESWSFLFASALTISCSSHATDSELTEIRRIETAWVQALVHNDAPAVERYLHDDWIIVDPDGGVMTKGDFLALIRSGDVVNDTMSLVGEPRVRVYGATAIFTARAVSSGRFKGKGYSADERSTDVFVKSGGEWKCVLSQIARVSGPPPLSRPTP